MSDIISVLKKVGGVVDNGHFVGNSGRHLPTYVNKDALLPHTKEASKVGKMFALKFKDKKIDAVVAPAVGGIALSVWTGHHLSLLTKKDVLSLFTEKTQENDQIFKRGFDKLVKGKRVLIVEDVVTTGGSVKKVVDSVKKAGGNVIGVCVMINKDPKIVTTRSVGAPLSYLAVLKVPSYDEKDCILCKKDIPVNTNLGHGKLFLEKISKKK